MSDAIAVKRRGVLRGGTWGKRPVARDSASDAQRGGNGRDEGRNGEALRRSPGTVNKATNQKARNKICQGIDVESVGGTFWGG